MSPLGKKIVLGISVLVVAYAATGYMLGRSSDDKAFRALTVYSEVLEHIQRDIADNALMRLGAWKYASEQRLNQRFADVQTRQQLDLFGERQRRIRQFDKEQKNLLTDEQRRHQEIRAMEQVRGDSIDAIGALVLIPQ